MGYLQILAAFGTALKALHRRCKMCCVGQQRKPNTQVNDTSPSNFKV